MSKVRNRYLTPAMERVLKWMIASDEKEEDGELAVEGGEAWYGTNRTSIATVNALLRLCALRDDSCGGSMSRDKFRTYSVNEEGRKLVNEPHYEPLITKHAGWMLSRGDL